MKSCSSVNPKSNVTPATKLIHFHGEQHQIDITSGEFKATNSSISTTTNQLLSDLSISEFVTTNMCLSSPCGEGNQLVKSNTTMNHNLQQCKTYATISSSNLKLSEDLKPSPNKDLISIEHNQTTLQPYILKPASDLFKETLLFYNNISFEPEYKTKSEYLQQIDPEPPPHMMQRFMLRPNIHGLSPSCLLYTSPSPRDS